MAASLPDLTNDGYDSDLEQRESRKTWRSDPLAKKDVKRGVRPSKQEFGEAEARETRRIYRHHGFMAMDAYARHKQFINFYCLHYRGKEHFVRDSSNDRNDFDVLAEHHQFLWEDDGDEQDCSWEKQLAKRYFDKLYKEYCIADLSRYRENKIALRWRMEKEVLDGKGQFVCGNKQCLEQECLTSWEVNFGYVEHGVKKNALVKLRLCRRCSRKLNYHHKHKKLKKKKRRTRKSSPDLSTSAEKKKGRKKRKEEKILHSDDTSGSEEDDEDGQQTGSSSALREGQATAAESSEQEEIWRKPAKVEVQRTLEEDFDDYFKDMFL